jgi:hypothetical protein
LTFFERARFAAPLCQMGQTGALSICRLAYTVRGVAHDCSLEVGCVKGSWKMERKEKTPGLLSVFCAFSAVESTVATPRLRLSDLRRRLRKGTLPECAVFGIFPLTIIAYMLICPA